MKNPNMSSNRYGWRNLRIGFYVLLTEYEQVMMYGVKRLPYGDLLESVEEGIEKYKKLTSKGKG